MLLLPYNGIITDTMQDTHRSHYYYYYHIKEEEEEEKGGILPLPLIIKVVFGTGLTTL